LVKLFSLAVRQMALDLSDKIMQAGFADHRDSFHNVMPYITSDGIRLTELAQQAGMTKQAMAELVLEAERLGYLRRSPDPTDGRAKIIQFTDKGWAAADAAVKGLAELEAELAERLGEATLRRLRKTVLDLLNRPAGTRRETAPPGTRETAPPGTRETAPPGTRETAPPGTRETAPPGTRRETAPPGRPDRTE
jgi:DNA-binding MarR family transcriptional regulator